MALEIHTLTALKDNFIYALTDNESGCAVIDPGEAGPVQAFLRHTGRRLSHILCTHHHWDHVDGVAELQSESGCAVWGAERDRDRIPGLTHALREGPGYELLGEPLAVMEVPGHTVGQIAYLLPKQFDLFVGDTLFSAGCGRLFEGTPAQMHASLRKIKALAPQTRIYFGHEYTLRNLEFVLSRIQSPPAELLEYKSDCEIARAQGRPTTPSLLARELKVNPFLYAESVDIFREWREARDRW
ncbi:MAG: hydroxyacylglutathione hydrolase [Bdellovibrionales bacterium]